MNWTEQNPPLKIPIVLSNPDPVRFQPLETVAWPQNSWTDTIHTVETKGFYRINVHLNN